MPSDPRIVAENAIDWQLDMFSKSLKKQQKLRLLLDHLGPLERETCLLITCGDNSGALNHHFREAGGNWTWIDLDGASIPTIEELLKEPVLEGLSDHLPVESKSFEIVVSIDVHEHLDNCSDFNRELERVTKPGGRVVVTTPNGGRWKPVNILKRLLGMTKEMYGHKVDGINVAQHTTMLEAVGLQVVDTGSYSRLFTESIELVINWGYIRILARRDSNDRPGGEIAPSTSEKLTSVGNTYRLYSLAYPLLESISRLDLILSPLTGYAVTVVARKPI